MKQLFKIIGIAAAVLVVLAAVSLVVLRQMFPPQRIQKIVLEELRARLNREIRLSDAQMGLTGVWIRGLEISEEPDFKAGTMAKAATLRVQPRLRALLSRRIEVAEVLLQGWECRILHRRDGTWNFESKTPTEPAAAPKRPTMSPNSTSAPSSLDRSWSIGKVRLEEGSVRYLDEASSTAMSMRSIRFAAQNVRPQGMIPLEASADYSAKDFSGSFQLKGDIDLGGLDAAKMSAKWTSLKLKHQGLAIEGSGSLKNLSAPFLTLEFSIPRQRLKPLDASRWPSQLPLLIPLHGRAEASKRGNLVDLKLAKIVWNSLKVEIGGKVALKDQGSPDLHLHLKTGLFSLSELAGLLPVAQKVGPKGQGDIDLRVDGPAGAPALAGQASLKGVGVMYQGQALSGLDASAQFTPQIVKADARGAWNRGRFQVSTQLRNYQKAPDLWLDGRISELDLGSLAQMQSVGPNVPKSAGDSSEAPSRATGSSNYPLHASGKLFIDKVTDPSFSLTRSTITWDLKDALVKSQMTGSVKFQAGPGRFQGSGTKRGGKVSLSDLLVVPTLLQGAGLSFVPKLDRFNTMSGDFAFQRGMMNIRDWRIDSDDEHLIITGKANLVDETLDMRLTARLVRAVPGLTGPIGLKIGGTFSNPTVKVDATSILKQPEVKKAVNKLLDNLFR